MYLCLYRLPHVCRTLVPKIRVHPEILHVFRYIDVLVNSPQGQLELFVSASREDYRQRQVGECADTWYKQIQPTETVEL